MALADQDVKPEMRRYIVALDRPRGSAGSRGAAIDANRRMTERFKGALKRMMSAEGLSIEMGGLDQTETLPVLYLMGTPALADRVRLMDGVRSVAPDAEFDLPVGKVVSRK